jgi:hypothetical protein
MARDRAAVLVLPVRRSGAVTTRAQREREHRRVPIGDADFERFRVELPGLIAFLEQRLVPRHRRWALGAIAYGVTTLAGLLLYDWSPVLVLTHVVLSQWIPLGAEIVALRRLQQRGTTRLVTADHVHRFVAAVVRALEAGRRPWDPPEGPMMLDRDRLDSEIPADSTDKTSPAALAATLLFFGLVGTAILGGSLWFIDPRLRDAMFAEPWALAALGAASLWQCYAEYRAKLAPPMPGARWDVEFHAGLRVMSVVLLGMLSPLMLEADHAQLREAAAAPAVLVGAWGLVSLVSLPLWRGTIAKLRRYVGLDVDALRASWSTSGRSAASSATRASNTKQSPS